VRVNLAVTGVDHQPFVIRLINQSWPSTIAEIRNEWLAKNISIPGIEAVERDTAFDDEKMRSAGPGPFFGLNEIYKIRVDSGFILKT
jgi:hypothetical protein